MPDLNNNTETGTAESTTAAPEPQNTGTPENGQGTNSQPLSGGTLVSGTGEANGAPEAYDFTSSLPEGAELDEGVAKSFGDIARGMNLTNEQANQLAKFGFDWAGKMEDVYIEQLEAQNKANIEDTKKELGGDFEKTMQKVAAATMAIERAYPGLTKLMATSPVFSDARMVKLIAKVGDLLSEDGGIGGAGAPNTKLDDPYPNTDWGKYKR
jgi:hypothetical protein